MLHPLYVPYSMCTSYTWAFPVLSISPRPPHGVSPREASLYAHSPGKSSSSRIFSGFFPLSAPLHAHRVGFLPGKLFSTPISPVNLHPLASSPGFSHSLQLPTPTAWGFSPGNFSLRPFSQQTIILSHHLRVFPTPCSAPRPPHGFSLREAFLYAHFPDKSFLPALQSLKELSILHT